MWEEVEGMGGGATRRGNRVGIARSVSRRVSKCKTVNMSIPKYILCIMSLHRRVTMVGIEYANPSHINVLGLGRPASALNDQLTLYEIYSSICKYMYQFCVKFYYYTCLIRGGSARMGCPPESARRSPSPALGTARPSARSTSTPPCPRAACRR